MEALGGGFMLILFLFGLFLLILWIILPFAVFGIKEKLDTLIYESQNLNNKMQMLNNALYKIIESQFGQQNTSTNPSNDPT